MNGVLLQKTVFSEQLRYVTKSGSLKIAKISFGALSDNNNADFGVSELHHYLSFQHKNCEDDFWIMFSRIRFVCCMSDWYTQDMKNLCSPRRIRHPSLILVIRDTGLSSHQNVTLVHKKRKRSIKLTHLRNLMDQRFNVVSWQLTAMDELYDRTPCPYTLTVSCNGLAFYKNHQSHHDSCVSYSSFAENRIRFIQTGSELCIEVANYMDFNIVASLKFSSDQSSQIRDVISYKAGYNGTTLSSNGPPTGVSSNMSSVFSNYGATNSTTGYNGTTPSSNGPPTCVSSNMSSVFYNCGRTTSTESTTTSTSIPSPSPCLGRLENNIFVATSDEPNISKHKFDEGVPPCCIKSNNELSTVIVNNESNIEREIKCDQRVKKIYHTTFDLHDQSISNEDVHVIEIDKGQSWDIFQLHRARSATYTDNDDEYVDPDQTFEKGLYSTPGKKKTDRTILNSVESEETELKQLYTGSIDSNNSCDTQDSETHVKVPFDTSSNYSHVVSRSRKRETSDLQKYILLNNMMKPERCGLRNSLTLPAACRMYYAHVWVGSAQTSYDDTSIHYADTIYQSAYHEYRNCSQLIAALDMGSTCRLQSTCMCRSNSAASVTDGSHSLNGIPRWSRLSFSESSRVSYALWDTLQDQRVTESQESISDNNSYHDERSGSIDRSLYARIRETSLRNDVLYGTSHENNQVNQHHTDTSLCLVLQSILERLSPPTPDFLHLDWRTFVHLRFALLDSTELIQGWQHFASKLGLTLHEVQMIEHFVHHTRTTPLDILLRFWQFMCYNDQEHPGDISYPPCNKQQLTTIFRDMQREDLVAIVQRDMGLNDLNNLNRICI